MNHHWRKLAGVLLFAAPFLALTTTVSLAEETVVAEKVAIQPEAMAALTEMGNYLNSHKSFRVLSEMSMDEVLLTGQKILVTGTTDYLTQLPHQLRISSKIEELGRDNEYFFDGKTFTIYSKIDKFYASFDAPGTIGELLDIAQERYDVDIPLRDLFYWGTEKEKAEDIQAAEYIDNSRVNGTPCKHYAFRQEEVDWQIWIEDDSTPLPRKLVITSKLENGQPQYITTLTWDLAPKLADSLFVFTPPEDAHKIEFAVYDDNEESTQK